MISEAYESLHKVDLWVAAALGVPIALATSLVTPWIQRWIDNRFANLRTVSIARRASRRQKQLKRAEEDLTRITGYMQNPATLHTHMLTRILGCFGMFALSAGLVMFVLAISPTIGVAASSLKLFTMGYITAAATLVFTFCNGALRDAARVRNYDAYKAEAEKFIARLIMSRDAEVLKMLVTK
jgi:hypothetical protein